MKLPPQGRDVSIPIRFCAWIVGLMVPLSNDVVHAQSLRPLDSINHQGRTGAYAVL